MVWWGWFIIVLYDDVLLVKWVWCDLGIVVGVVGIEVHRSGIQAWEPPPTGDNTTWQQNTEIKTHAAI